MSLLTDEAAMSLQQLVDYFNDRFESEHQSNFRPFILENGWVSGIFGPIRVSSVFAPVHPFRIPSFSQTVRLMRMWS